jgi:pyruvate,water dikinase
MTEDLLAIERLLGTWGEGATCAVRSSSPEEDLESASFAGGYVTVLGVDRAGIAAAVRDCFVSALDERVVVYKQQQGFDVRAPRIAVLVQRQIESEVAGVGFSLNPVTNDFDEAVVDSSVGLGGSVVSGDVTPDHFVIDKAARKVIERRLGEKARSRWVKPGGGVELREQSREGESSLSDEQLFELVDALESLERVYGHPVDIEWAYAGGELHLLQSRPVTAFVPLPAEMLTAPGEKRRLYVDRSLTDGFTTNAPLSTLTLDSAEMLVRELAEMFDFPWDEETGEPPLIHLSGLRLYVDYSSILWIASPEKLAAPLELVDQLLSRTIENVDAPTYKPVERPWIARPLKWLGILFRAIRKSGRVIWLALLSFLSIPRFMRHFEAQSRTYEQAVADTPDDAPVARMRELNAELVRVLWTDLGAIYPWAAASWAIESLRKRSDEQTSALLDAMNRGYEGEFVVAMGIDMYSLAHLIDASEYEDLTELERKIGVRALPEPFLAAWDRFLATYGCRGPMEMELSSPRYSDTPEILLRQMSFMVSGSDDYDPKASHQRAVVERKQALAELLERSGWFRRWRLRLGAKWIDAYAGERETPKHHWVMLAERMRTSALSLGRKLQAAGRLDSDQDVFHLKWDELEAAEGDPEFDVRTPARQRSAYFHKLAVQVREFPHVIDSRGRILRPAPADEGEGIPGLGISPGVARGPIKVLHDPYEKEIEPGDVLVAYTTDPGWTPLFVNAGAIILQVGGVMQHGGVVAREYGKPCVAGIERVLTRFEDGQVVEVDGSSGQVRIDL